jgi:nucleotide-binding universal stress UspA family protein
MYSKVLCGTDGSATAARAVARAVELARAADAELVVIHAHPESNLGQFPSGDHPAITTGKQILSDVESQHASEVKLRTLLRQGEAASVILDVAEEEEADLIIVGNRGMSGVGRFLVGSVPNRVSHHSPCDVLIVHTT